MAEKESVGEQTKTSCTSTSAQQTLINASMIIADYTKALVESPLEGAEHALMANERTIYLKNCSDYIVRISVGPLYPTCIALYPGEIKEFPAKDVSTISASTYGKVSHYLSGLVAETNVAGLLRERPDCASKDCIIQITYDSGSGQTGFWSYASYLFTQGKWMLTVRPVDKEKDLPDYQGKGSYSENLYSIIARSSGAIPEPIVRDAAFIWSMFSRAAAKIEHKEPVYPFNILGLDVGGLVASDVQLRNWGSLLSSSLRRRYGRILNTAIWNAVNMIIADSVESLRRHNYYVFRDPDYPVTLLHIPGYGAESQQEPSFPLELLNQLKEKVKGDESAQTLLGQIEEVARTRGLVSTMPQPAPVPPAPPAPPVASEVKTISFQERAVASYIKDLKEKNAEAYSLLDVVANDMFEKNRFLGYS